MVDIVNIGLSVDSSGVKEGRVELNKLGDQAGRTSTATGKMNKSTKKLGHSVQNASYQLQDMVVQLQMGTDASRVMGQQLPQLLGGFGPLGAVLGLVAGLLAGLIPMMFSAGDAAESAADDFMTADDALDEMRQDTAQAELELIKLQNGFDSIQVAKLVGELNTLKSKLKELDDELLSSDSFFAALSYSMSDAGEISNRIKEVEDAIAKNRAANAELREKEDEEKAAKRAEKEEARAILKAEREAQRLSAQQDAKLEALRKGYMNESELAMNAYLEQQELINELEEASKITEEEKRELELEALLQYEEAKTRIAENAAKERLKLEKKANADKRKAEAQFWSDSTALMASGSRSLFAIGKAASIAKAVIDGYAAAVAAWRFGMSTGGPWVAAAYAAASVAKTASLIASIKSTQFSGGGGTSVSGGSVGAVSVNSGATTVATGDSARNEAKEIRVVFEGDNPHSDAMRSFAKSLQETMADMGSDINMVYSMS